MGGFSGMQIATIPASLHPAIPKSFEIPKVFLSRVCDISGIYLGDAEIRWDLLELRTKSGNWFCRISSQVIGGGADE